MVSKKFFQTALEDHNLHLQEKYDLITDNVRRVDHYRSDDAEWLLVAYGTAARVAKKAVDRLRDAGVKAGLFRPLTLWPFPDRELRKVAPGISKVLTVEMSLGQKLVYDAVSASGTVVSSNVSESFRTLVHGYGFHAHNP